MNIYSLKNKGVAGNIWKLILVFITNKRTYMTFFSIFLLTLPNTTAQTVGFIAFIGQIFGFIFEVPSGYLSDKLGHKKALVLGKICIAFSTLFFLIATSTYFFVIGAILMALGQAMLSGTLATFIQETLITLNRGKDFSSIMGKMKSMGFLIPIIFIILLPILAEHNYRLAFLVVLIIDIVGVIATILLKKIDYHKNIEEFEIKPKVNLFKEYIKIGWLPYVITASFLFAILFSATAGFKNPFQEEIGFTISMLGILWAFSRVGVSGLLLVNGWFKKNFSFKQVLLLQGFVYTLVLIMVGTVSNKWIIAASFIIGTTFMWGFSSVKTHFFLEYVDGSRLKATFLSINNFIEKIISSIFSLLMGYLVLTNNYQYGFFFFGLLGIIILLFGLVFLKNKKTV